MSELHCFSFHSVKGGVGKSTLAVCRALDLCTSGDFDHVILIDMDLTGTSLADVLAIVSPRWFQGAGKTPLPDKTRLPLRRAPDDVYDLEATHREMANRDAWLIEPEPAGDHAPRALGVPFLNDYLLYATPDWKPESDAVVNAFLWKPIVATDPDSRVCQRLHVIPSSALPADLERILPVIFDEPHAGFLEARLEWLLNGLMGALEGKLAVVFDTPPTIPGLSRTVFSMGLRLGHENPDPLSEDRFIPARLRNGISWTSYLVSTPDRQDRVALNRWLKLLDERDRAHVHIVVNREQDGERTQVVKAYRKELLAAFEETKLVPDNLWYHPVYVSQHVDLQFFRRTAIPLTAAQRVNWDPLDVEAIDVAP